jgi:hypothetical protein
MKQPQLSLLSLPFEIRLRIYHFTLAGWQVLLDAWCESLSGTLVLKRDRDIYGPDCLSLFHINGQIRSEATSLIGDHATLCFMRGPRSAWDRRWRTSGRPLPDLIRQNVQHANVVTEDLSVDFVLPLKTLPHLKAVTFQSDSEYIDEGFDWSLSMNWANYHEIEKAKQRLLCDATAERCMEGSWMLDLYEARKSLPFELLCESGIMFPDLKNGEVKMMVCCISHLSVGLGANE